MDSRRLEAFRVLGIPVDSDRVTVARAYRRLALATHPDVSADPLAAERFATLTEAYKVAAEVSAATAEHPAAAQRVGPWSVGPPDLYDIWPEDQSGARSLASATAARLFEPPRPPIVAGPVSIRPPWSRRVRRLDG